MITDQPIPNLKKLKHEEKNTFIVKLWKALEVFENAVRKDSHNSSKPPSSDGLAKKTKSLRKASGKPRGGQIGHKGHTLTQVAAPTQIIEHPLPQQCTHCHEPLPKDGAQVATRRQIFDVPLVPYDIIEHRSLEQQCKCGQRHMSAFPAHVTENAQYGPNVRALAVHLTQGQLLPYARATELIADVYGLKVSKGAIVLWVNEARATLQSTADVIADHLRQASLVHADESGLRVEGKLRWLHIAANETHTWYGIHEKRGMEAIQAHGILPKLMGVLVHDCWAPYWQLACPHALCNAHLLRELVYVQELTGQDWPQQMMNLLLGSNQLCQAAREQKRVFKLEEIAAFTTVYEGILREGETLHPEIAKNSTRRGRSKQSVAFNLLRRLRLHRDSVLFFIRDLAVPFTNNLGERAVRMPKVKQKISGCFRSLEGAENFCVIRSCLDTLRKQGYGMLEVLQRAFAGNPIQPAAG
jgi:transposase